MIQRLPASVAVGAGYAKWNLTCSSKDPDCKTQTGAAMNEPLDPDIPDFPEPLASDFPTAEIRPAEKKISYWLKRFLSCNPFYIFSAALLLYGLYRASIEPKVLTKETAHLIFNFSSLQCYELLLAGTAVILARPRLSCDS